MLVKGTTILKSPVKLILCESVLQKKQRHIARKHRKGEVDVNLNSGSDEMSSESWIKVDCGDALLQDQDLPTSLASNDPDAPKAKSTPRSKCPTRSFETRQYRVARGSAGEDKVEVVRERIYVGGLNSEVTGELLAEVFSQYGQVGFTH